MRKIVQDHLNGILIPEAIKGVKRLLKSEDYLVEGDTASIESAIYNHINTVKNKTDTVNISGLNGIRFLNDIYIDIDIQLERRSNRSYGSDYEKFTITKLMSQESIKRDAIIHIILLGGPGAGKTTTVRNVCHLLLDTEFTSRYTFPILINLRELKPEETIYSRIKNNIGISFFKKNTFTNEETPLNETDTIKFQNCINQILNDLKVILILDGLDEVDPSKLENTYHEVEYLTSNLDQSLVILTSRSAALDSYFDNSEEYELCDLDNVQVSDFVFKWFESSDKSEQFLRELKESQYYDLSIKPLTLTHLCAIYERQEKLYDRPRLIYQGILDLLIYEWDQQRRVKRRKEYFVRKIDDVNYTNFDQHDKARFLTEFAYDLTTNHSLKVYSHQDFLESYERIYDNHNLPKGNAKKVVKEIEAHNGIIINAGFDRFQFSHKSLQENMTAEYMIKSDSVPFHFIESEEISIPDEFAITICLSSNHNISFYNFIFIELSNRKFVPNFILRFLERLYQEKPIFKTSILLPLSFIAIYNLFYKSIVLARKRPMSKEERLELDKSIRSKLKDFEVKLVARINTFRESHFSNKSFAFSRKYFDLKWVQNEDGLYILEISNDVYMALNEYECELIHTQDRYYVSQSLFELGFQP